MEKMYEKTVNEVIPHIKNGTRAADTWYYLRKILKHYDMEQYSNICERRILHEICIDDRSVDIDLVNGGIILSRLGILKCKDIICEFISENQMNELIELCNLDHESKIAINNFLWVIRNTSVKTLKDKIRNKDDIECAEIYRQEIMARKFFIRMYRFVFKEVKRRYHNILFSIVHFSEFRYLKRSIKQDYESGKLSSIKVPINTDKAELFRNYFERCKAINPASRRKDDSSKYILSGVKYFIRRKRENLSIKSLDQIEQDYKDMKGIINAISDMTPAEFIHVFPVDKEFDGDKYQMKDYFYTQEMLKEFEKDKPIGNKRVVRFLEDYHNIELCHFICNWSSLLSDYSVYCGRNEPFEEYLSDLESRCGTGVA